MQMLFEKTCVICHAEKLTFQKRKMVLGIATVPECYACENCGSIFIEDELRWKLVSIKDKLHPIWQQCRKKSFYVREWMSIGKLESPATSISMT